MIKALLLAISIGLAVVGGVSAGVLILTTTGGGGGGGGGACNILDFSQACNSQYLALGGLP